MAYIEALGALSDATRRTILESLRGGASTVGDIARQLPVSRPAVSQHLKVLREAGIVVETRQGTRHYFAIHPPAVVELRNYFEAMWQQALRAYARHVATEEEEHGRTQKRKRRRGR